jgi:KaiC/GvpD/RAD55 family RecA-like ATPase
METTTFTPKIISGIEVVDRAWGGLYRGGSYLVYGRAASGRGLLTLMFVQTGALLEEPCLFISPERPKDLMIEAAAIGFDLKKAHDDGWVRLVRIPPSLSGQGDEQVTKALAELGNIIRKNRPARLVINDFMPFVTAFRSLDWFRTAFQQLLEEIDPLDTTMMLVMSEPNNPMSQQVVGFVSSQLHGAIHIEQLEDDFNATMRRVTMLPNKGHFRRQEVDWDLEKIVRNEMEMPTARRVLPTRHKPGAAPSGAAARVKPATEPAEAATEPAPEAPKATVKVKEVISKPTKGREVTRKADAPADTAEAPAATSEVSAATAETPPARPAEMNITDRAGFTRHLQQHFTARDQHETPFLLLAMRMDRSEGKTVRPFDFEFILDVVQATLRPQDAMLAQMENERLVVLLGESRSEEAQHFFARLKSRLRDDAPQQADYLLHSVSAIVVPDGRPFQTAEEFLGYALDEA